jgi:MinD-like ATPase involved in chromosome partitioning or flagellar assembly
MSTGLSVLEKENKKKSVRSNNNNSKVILFSSVKGGNGASFISNCVSSYLAKTKIQNILLLDLNIGKRDSRIIFNLEEKDLRDIGDIEDSIKEIDISLLKRLVVNFDNSLNLILPPLKPEKNKICCGKNLSLLLGILKHYYEIICVDFPYYLFMKNDFDFTENVDKFVFVSMADLISVSNLEIFSRHICVDDIPNNIKIIINKFNTRPAVSPARLNSILKYPVQVFIPYDRDIEFLYHSKGPFYIFNYNLRIVKNIIDFSELLYEELDFDKKQ